MSKPAPKPAAKAKAKPSPKAKAAPKAQPKPAAKAEPKATPITDKVKAIIAGSEPQPAPEPKPADPDLWTELDFGHGDLFRIESRADDRCQLLKATIKNGTPTGWKPIGGEMEYLTDALRRIADVLDGKPIG